MPNRWTGDLMVAQNGWSLADRNSEGGGKSWGMVISRFRGPDTIHDIVTDEIMKK
jgi:hypothetical protein